MKKSFFYFCLFLLIFFIIFHTLILNPSTHLLSWLDYPLVIWIIFQNLAKITSLQFTNYFDTNAFYPHKNTLLFADTNIPQAIISLPFSFISKNPILVFNFTFILTFILNYIALFLFWRLIFKKELVAFFGTLFFLFSPFFHQQLGHFQMQFYWPFFFTLYFLFKNETQKNDKNLLLAGMLLSIQFLASVYLAVFLLFSIFTFSGIKILFSPQWKTIAKSLLIIIGVFILITGIFIKGYLDVKNFYGIKREYGEYILYSAHLSDYLFTTNINSTLHKLPPLNHWNSFDKHIVGEKASFPGFLLSILFLLGIFSFIRKKDKLLIIIELDKRKLFFLIILFFGFLFSLGPRLNFNETYLHIPTPYTLFLKFIPFLDSIRAPARWSFLCYLGVIYFSLSSIKKIFSPTPSGKIFPLIIFALFVIEYLPLNLKASAEGYKEDPYPLLVQICRTEKKVLMEIPVTHFRVKGGIVAGLNYISKVLLSSLYHQCYLVNGYSGYQPQNLFKLEDDIERSLSKQNVNTLVKIFLNNRIDLVKLNEEQMLPETKLNLERILPLLLTNEKIEVLRSNILRIKY